MRLGAKGLCTANTSRLLRNWASHQCNRSLQGGRSPAAQSIAATSHPLWQRSCLLLEANAAHSRLLGSFICNRGNTGACSPSQSRHCLGIVVRGGTDDADKLQSVAEEMAGWRSLGTPPSELRLEFTLPTGQSFRWRATGPDEYTGVIQQRVVQMRQTPDDVLWRVLARGPNADQKGDVEALRDYFNLDTRLGLLAKMWARQDARFAAISPYFPGARMLRQDPLECLFQFVCSSNNHISRIAAMVDRLCKTYGTELVPAEAQETAKGLGQPRSLEEGEIQPRTPPKRAQDAEEEERYHAFPTLEQLTAATEEDLRAAGFGYRAKFIVGSVAALRDVDGGGAAWLRDLRSKPYAEATEALEKLPGIGPKVAACICLFSLDKAEAIPVDTHVWQVALRHYTPQLQGKTLNRKLMAAVEAAFQERFGSHAGWAHNTLFISELAAQRHLLPEHLQPPGSTGKQSSKSKKAKLAEAAAQGALAADFLPEDSAQDLCADAQENGGCKAEGEKRESVRGGRAAKQVRRTVKVAANRGWTAHKVKEVVVEVRAGKKPAVSWDDAWL